MHHPWGTQLRLAIDWVCFAPEILFRLIGVGSVNIGGFWHGSLLKNSWLGLIPSTLAIFLQAARASVRLAFSAFVQVTIALRFFAAVSARPFDSGLWADASLCCIEFTLQNSLNSCQYCGPLSVPMVFGQPKKLNSVVSSSITLAKCLPASCFSHAYPK